MYSFKESSEIIWQINERLGKAYNAGQAVELAVNGRPSFRILSFEPLLCEPYGIIRNRAPRIVGDVALRAFLAAPHADGATRLAIGMEVNGHGYGQHLDLGRQSHFDIFNQTAEQFGFNLEYDLP